MRAKVRNFTILNFPKLEATGQKFNEKGSYSTLPTISLSEPDQGLDDPYGKKGLLPWKVNKQWCVQRENSGKS